MLKHLVFQTKLTFPAGFFLVGISIALCINLNLQVNPNWIILSNILFGIGSATALVPVSGIALGTLTKDQIPSGAGIHSLSKCVTGSIATSIASSMTISLAQVHQTYLIKNMGVCNYNFVNHFNILKMTFMKHSAEVIAIKKANYVLYKQLLVQAKLCAISDLFAICTLMTFLMIPLVILLRVEHKNSVVKN